MVRWIKAGSLKSAPRRRAQVLPGATLPFVSTYRADISVLTNGGFLDHRSHYGAKMDKTSGTPKDAADELVKRIKRKTRKNYSAEEKIRIVLARLRGEESISALCRREGITESVYCPWTNEFLEAGKARRRGSWRSLVADRSDWRITRTSRRDLAKPRRAPVQRHFVRLAPSVLSEDHA
jgi:transposase